MFHYMSGWTTRNTKVGNGLDESVNMGPLVSVEQFDRVTGYISSGRDDGANIIGGDRVGDRGYFVAPTILTGTREEMKAVQEEIFGPVVAAAPFRADHDILPTANNTGYGLGAGVFTRDIGKAYRTARRLRSARLPVPHVGDRFDWSRIRVTRLCSRLRLRDNTDD